MTSRPSTAAPILAMLAIVLVTLGAYVVAYLLRGPDESDLPYVRARAFASYAECCLFWPAMYAEGLLSGESVLTEYPADDETVIEIVYKASR